MKFSNKNSSSFMMVIIGGGRKLFVFFCEMQDLAMQGYRSLIAEGLMDTSNWSSEDLVMNVKGTR